jgi:cell wall-associated NlpC family hydrolase
LINLKRISSLSVCAIFLFTIAAADASAQDRERVVRTVSSQPVNQPAPTQPPPARTTTLSSSAPVNTPRTRPPMTNEIVVRNEEEDRPLVKKTGESRSTASMAAPKRAAVYSSDVSNVIMSGIQARLGIPYLYGSTGPYRYDCSGFVWAVFRDAGLDFIRSSARSLWNASVPVEGDERYKFGTLVFMNNLGHMGIVADENGFYHASQSKGIIYSPFKGYWEKRIVGFRRLILPVEAESK